ncbi:hypothetical protein KUTeg_002043 [Tegillarca granosa]|uniref:Cytochrome P450 n=1 Tax=Tegillarca granosa TaxID=220873 RepID=A0ABQ9FWD5_TEGGR|nr:hypothetical protein KUTeg_002043 [Tegillarca granosa]
MYVGDSHPYVQAVNQLAQLWVDRVREDLSKMEYLTRCIKEGLRLHCPVPFVQRKITKELKIDDVTFPAGTSFTIHIYNLHHNPRVWNEPMKYDPDRFCAANIKTKDSFAFVPFSAGPRYRIELDKDHTVKRKIAGVMQAENGIKIKLHKREHSKSLI